MRIQSSSSYNKGSLVLQENASKEEISEKIKEYFSIHPRTDNFIINIVNDDKVVHSMYASRYNMNKESLFTFSYKCLTELELVDELYSFATKKREVQVECKQVSTYRVSVSIPESVKDCDVEEYIKSNFNVLEKKDKRIYETSVDFTVDPDKGKDVDEPEL